MIQFSSDEKITDCSKHEKRELLINQRLARLLKKEVRSYDVLFLYFLFMKCPSVLII